jgi:hypothetical protein
MAKLKRPCAMTAEAGRDVGPGSGPYRICLSRNQVRTLFRQPSMDRAEADRRRLGCGSWACVWDRSDGTVVKVTRDPEDVAAFQAVKGLPHVVKAYEFFSLPGCCEDEKTKKQVKAWAMVLEKVNPIPPKYEDWIKHKFCRARLSLRLDVARQKSQKTPKEKFKVSRMTRDKIKNACTEVESGDQAACNAFGKSLMTTFERMYHRGVDWIDMNENNIGMDNRGRWAALDLGMSDVPLSQRPIVLLGGGKPARCKIVR